MFFKKHIVCSCCSKPLIVVLLFLFTERNNVQPSTFGCSPEFVQEKLNLSWSKWEQKNRSVKPIPFRQEVLAVGVADQSWPSALILVPDQPCWEAPLSVLSK